MNKTRQRNEELRKRDKGFACRNLQAFDRAHCCGDSSAGLDRAHVTRSADRALTLHRFLGRRSRVQ
jgi:hypothetical protein